MPTQQEIDALISGYGSLQAYFETQRANLQADIATAEGAYGALANNLVSTIRNEMHFSATVDPDEANPTNVEGGTFNTVVAAVEAAPAGSYAQIKLLAGKTYVVDTNIRQNNVTSLLYKDGDGANPVLDVQGYATATFNVLYGFLQNGLSSVKLENVDVQLPAVLPDPGLPLSSSDSLVRYSAGGETSLVMRGGTVTGSNGFGLISAHAGTVAKLSLHAITLDGAIYGVTSAVNGIAQIAPYTTTLLNGAALSEGGVIGTNMLQS